MNLPPPSDDPRPLALNHIHLTAEDPDAEIAFLTDALGFRKDPNLPGFVWRELDLSGPCHGPAGKAAHRAHRTGDMASSYRP